MMNVYNQAYYTISGSQAWMCQTLLSTMKFITTLTSPLPRWLIEYPHVWPCRRSNNLQLVTPRCHSNQFMKSPASSHRALINTMRTTVTDMCEGLPRLYLVILTSPSPKNYDLSFVILTARLGPGKLNSQFIVTARMPEFRTFPNFFRFPLIV